MTPQEHIAAIIKEISGKDYTEDENTKNTPNRVVKSWETLFVGYQQNPQDILSTRFPSEHHQGIVILKNIEFYSTCSHHMLPFFGKAHVGYIPSTQVVGLSKLARLVDCFSRRLQLQEAITDQVADAIMAELNAMGAMVVLEAKHMCMCARGVAKQESSMMTSSVRGKFRTSHIARQEFLSLIGK